jgi:hypothetical protein
VDSKERGDEKKGIVDRPWALWKEWTWDRDNHWVLGRLIGFLWVSSIGDEVNDGWKINEQISGIYICHPPKSFESYVRFSGQNEAHFPSTSA